MTALRSLFVLCAFLSLMTSAHVDAQARPVHAPFWAQTQAGEIGDITPTQVIAGPAWRWRPILVHPRVGGRFTTVTIDPINPETVLIGTEEGTIFTSYDGGVTWEENYLRPFVVIDRSLGLQVPQLPALGGVTPPSITLLINPPDRSEISYPSVPFVSYTPSMPSPRGIDFQQRGDNGGGVSSYASGRPVFPDYISPFFVPPPGLSGDLLSAVAASRRIETNGVRNIQICRGNDFPYLAVTKRALYASIDGLNWLRIFAIPGAVEIYRVSCSPVHPRRVALATGFGLYFSHDGGLTFDRDLSGWPGQATNTVQTGFDDTLFAANGSVLFAGNPDTERGMVMVYPDFNNAETAPWKQIRFVTVTEGQVWLATDDGVRASLDNGQNWIVPERLLFSRYPIKHIAAGATEEGNVRIAALMARGPAEVQGQVYATDDRGQTWFPFFEGLTRRGLDELGCTKAVPGRPGRWLILAGHEVWGNYEPSGEQTGEIDWEISEWARRKLRRTPPIAVVIEETLEATGVRADTFQRWTDGLAGRAWVPELVLTADMVQRRDDFLLSWPMGSLSRGLRVSAQPANTRERENDNWDFRILLQGTWYLKDMLLINEQINVVQNQVHELRRQVSFIAEDAWKERLQHLQRIARGTLSPYQAEVLKQRVETLEAMFEAWLGRPIEELGPYVRRE